ncbi:Rrf2 family protein [Pontibacter aydingkolensis]|uniref:Rrf2 family transcriptional regulator n=1 Tax=Pontibacter aydingkolensis TaxID=1911536 RepID=A0ABS7CSU3_9BACT|nr:Rrf2 family transcriptional regulator [Pontibacter aydingkolensis]MBW7466923.1 Rrf2 family transcriptional regulator [Pontibacter aydingkolensis]
MLSKTTEYALRAIVYIALHNEDGHKIGIKEVAKELDLPQPFTAKILQDLVRKGVIASLKGPGGGFYLHKPASELTILDVVRNIDGLEAFKKCGMGMKECSGSHPCLLHNDIVVYRDHLLKVFRSKSIQDLVDSVKTGKYFITNAHE